MWTPDAEMNITVNGHTAQFTGWTGAAMIIVVWIVLATGVVTLVLRFVDALS